jgi:divalent metal cation (Fe/Co/Zn/Cd) transporter
MGIATTTEPSAARPARRALRLEKLTIGWNTIECIVAVSAGIAAGSIALTGFGIDSAIETASALVVLHHLRAELGGRRPNEAQEQRALRFIAATFFALAAYVSVDSLITLIGAAHPETSRVGITVTAVSLVVMPVLARAKHHTGQALGNRLLIADARETTVCARLSASTLGGLVAFGAFGWWWADPLAALVVAGFALKEGREAWNGELVCDDEPDSGQELSIR